VFNKNAEKQPKKSIFETARTQDIVLEEQNFEKAEKV
jgi:hypothetical protein